MDTSRTAEVRILDELSQLIRLFTRLSGSLEALPTLTATQRLALLTVEEEAPIRVVDLAARLGVTAPTASRAVDALVEVGLVTRVPDPCDRRALRLAPTPEGRRQLDERRRRVTATFGPAAQTLTPDEREQLAELLSRLRAELERHASTD